MENLDSVRRENKNLAEEIKVRKTEGFFLQYFVMPASVWLKCRKPVKKIFTRQEEMYFLYFNFVQHTELQVLLL